MTGSGKTKRGLSGFLSAELSRPRTELEAPKSVSSKEPKPVAARRPEPQTHDAPRAHEAPKPHDAPKAHATETITARPPPPPAPPAIASTPAPPPMPVEFTPPPPMPTPPIAASAVTKSVSHEVAEPLYQRLTRKEVRFRDDQLEGLDRLTRRLSRARRGFKGERVTENTLVRVAVDLLIEHHAQPSGTSEAELLASLRQLARRGR